MRAKRPNLSRLEWEIMQVVWGFDKAPSVRQVLEKAYPDGQKAYTTVQTVMNNLERKGYLKKEKIGLVNFYSPVHASKELIQSETNSFIKRVFHGSFLSLTNFLLEGDDLSPEDIEGLKRLIERKEKNDDATQ